MLRACGIDEETANCSIRFGIGRFNTEQEIDYVGTLIADKVDVLRRESAIAAEENTATEQAKVGRRLARRFPPVLKND